MRTFIVLLVVALPFLSCRRQKDLNVPLGKVEDYYPLVLNAFKIYEVQESRYSLQGRVDTVYLLKESVRDVWKDLEGGDSYKLFRYKKAVDAEEFVMDSIWYAKKVSNERIVVTENNVPYVKILYPLYENKNWNGNLYNPYGTENYTLRNVGMPWANFIKTISVIEKNDTNLLHRNYRLIRYAEDIGVVYKEWRMLNFQRTGDITQGVIEDGIIRKQRLVSYGME